MPTTLLVAYSPGFSDPPPALRPRLQAEVIPGIAAAVVAAVFMVP